MIERSAKWMPASERSQVLPLAGTPRHLAYISPPTMVMVKKTKTPSSVKTTRANSPRPRMVRYQVMACQTQPDQKMPKPVECHTG